MTKILDILIPTYNRSFFLKKNIDLLCGYIENVKANKKINIIISDNCSKDDTEKVVLDCISNNPDVSFTYYKQLSNVGLEKNAVFTLSKSTSTYSMFLGDDDYIEQKYLETILEILEKDNTVSCVIPSFRAIDLEGVTLPGGRDLNEPSIFFEKGLDSATNNFWRGHQLSGVTFLREGTLENYLQSGYRNIYLFMYFVGFNCIRGRCFHFTEFPVKVTQTSQEKKDWNYGRDGLNDERHKNAMGLFKGNCWYLFLAEKNLIVNNNRSFFLSYLKESFSACLHYVKTFLRSKNVSVAGKLFFLFISFFDVLVYPLRKIKRGVLKKLK